MLEGVDILLRNLEHLSLLIPIIIGAFNYKKLNIPLSYIYFFLIIALFNSLKNTLLKEPLSYNIRFYIYHLIFNVVYAIVFFYWAEVKTFNKYILLQIIFYLLSVLIEIYTIGISTFRISVAVLINQILYCFFAVILINRILSNSAPIADKRVKLLVLIPFFIFYTYMSLIDIFMVFLYGPITQKLFTDLWRLIRILNPINYLCVSLAFYLAPKKQVYLQ